MGEPINFEGSNVIMRAPEGAEDVQDMHVYRTHHSCVSCWTFSPEELAEINQTGRVFLSVLAGGQQPPVYVGSESTCRDVMADFGTVWPTLVRTPAPQTHLRGSDEMLRLAVAAVLEADAEFRSNLPKDWGGDPLSDELDGLRRIFEATPPSPHVAVVTDDLRKRIMFAIFDPGASEGFKGDRDLTTWQTDAVVKVLNETLGGTGDDCSHGKGGAWPPLEGASNTLGNDSLRVVTAGETAPSTHVAPSKAHESIARIIGDYVDLSDSRYAQMLAYVLDEVPEPSPEKHVAVETVRALETANAPKHMIEAACKVINDRGKGNNVTIADVAFMLDAAISASPAQHLNVEPIGYATVRVEDTCDGLMINADDMKRLGLQYDVHYEGHFLPDGRYRIAIPSPAPEKLVAPSKAHESIARIIGDYVDLSDSRYAQMLAYVLDEVPEPAPSQHVAALQAIRDLAALDNEISGASAIVMSRMADIYQHADAALATPEGSTE